MFYFIELLKDDIVLMHLREVYKTEFNDMFYVGIVENPAVVVSRVHNIKNKSNILHSWMHFCQHISSQQVKWYTKWT